MPLLLAQSCLVSPGGGAFANFVLLGGQAFANPGPFLSFWHTHSFLSGNNYTEDFTGKESRLAQIGSCQSRGWGICKFCAARGPGICQPRGHSWAFDTHAVSYQKITTQRILLGKKADWLICQGQEKLKRFVKACSWFYACISSLLIEPELHSEIGSYRRESTLFGYWIKFLLILFEEHPSIFIKLFITYNLTTLYYFNGNNFTSIPKL